MSQQVRQPPYHLRPNKAVDRFVFIEALRMLEKFGLLSDCTYYGFGGPYLEEFRILYESWPKIDMVSIEEIEEIYKRQKFHLPFRGLRLVYDYFASFLAQYDPKDRRSIFWLDNTRLESQAFEDLALLLRKVADLSVIKITLRCEPLDFHDAKPEERQKKVDDFRGRFDTVLPSPSVEPPPTLESLASLLQDMVAVASQKALRGLNRAYQPLSSFCYADGDGMFTFTGIVCSCDDQQRIRRQFRSWAFANLDWSPPRLIHLPHLSTKERLHLQKCLPRRGNQGRVLRRALGYLIENDEEKSEAILKQYADFHRCSPYFMKAIP